TNSWADSPGAFLSIARWLTHQTSFSTYLMFQPPTAGSIPVPMYKVQWSWTGTATNPPPWFKLAGAPSPSTPYQTRQFPSWTNVITFFHHSPGNCTTNNCF